MTSVVGAVDGDDGEDANDREDAGDRDPYGGARIEVSEDDLRTAAAPVVLAGRLKRRLDGLATALTYGR